MKPTRPPAKRNKPQSERQTSSSASTQSTKRRKLTNTTPPTKPRTPLNTQPESHVVVKAERQSDEPQSQPHAPSKPPTRRQTLLSRSTKRSLQTEHALLQLLHHRNKNQHGRAVWYRHFSAFRREVRRLLGELDTPCFPHGAADNTPPSGSQSTYKQRSAPTRASTLKRLPNQTITPAQKAQRRATKRTLRRQTKRETKKRQTALAKQRVQFWQRVGLIEAWFAAFSGLVGDGQFAALGVVLVGVLARVCNLTRVLQETEQVVVESGSGSAEINIAERKEVGEEENGRDAPFDAAAALAASTSQSTPTTNTLLRKDEPPTVIALATSVSNATREDQATLQPTKSPARKSGRSLKLPAQHQLPPHSEAPQQSQPPSTSSSQLQLQLPAQPSQTQPEPPPLPRALPQPPQKQKQPPQQQKGQKEQAKKKKKSRNAIDALFAGLA